MPKFMAVNSIFLKARFVQTLLLAVGIDANGKNLLLAWAVVERENKIFWTWFFEHLKHAIPQALKVTLISDCDKGLLAADGLLGDDMTQSICCFRLKCNFAKQYQAFEHHFWRIADALTEHEYTVQLHEL